MNKVLTGNIGILAGAWTVYLLSFVFEQSEPVIFGVTISAVFSIAREYYDRGL